MKIEEEKNNKNWNIDFRYVVGGVTILGGIFGLYFSFKRDKREMREEKFIEKCKSEPVKKNNLDCL